MPSDEIILEVRGMTCVSCAAHVEGALQDLPGVESVSVSLRLGTARVTYIPDVVTVAAMKRVVEHLGYGAREQIASQAVTAANVYDNEGRVLMAGTLSKTSTVVKQGTFIPALRFAWLTPLYDPILRWVMREDQFKKEMIRQADLSPGLRVLDLGCGTATLTIMIKEAHPGTEVVGLDVDPNVLSIGRAKALKAGVSVTLDQGVAYALPYLENAFDRVLSSLMFHHLTSQKKQQTLKEVYRVLKPDGWLWIADFGPPAGLWARIISPLMARLEEVGDHHKGLIPVTMQDAGFRDIVERCRFSTVFGTLIVYGGRK